MNYKSVFLLFKHFIKFEWEIRYIRCLRQHSITTNKAYSQKVRIGIHTKSMDVILTKKEKKGKKK